MISACLAQAAVSSTGPSLEVDRLKEALGKAFLHPDFKRVRWAGVIGSVARGTAHERSDVDLLVMASPRNRSDPPPPPDTQLLEEALPRTLGRPVDVVYLEEGQTALRGYIQLEALLTSKTGYIRNDRVGVEVARLRKPREDCLRQGLSRFTTAIGQIQQVHDEFDGVSREV
jgi:predicted nucleotidyltransferase